MKKFICTLILFLSTHSFADTAIENALNQIRQDQSIESKLISQADTERNVIAQETDRVLDMLLSIPFEQRQYIYPALFNKPTLPKKIRKHPEIAIWEGKVPTRIAPQAEEYAQKYLYDMKPDMYIYLSPDAYPEEKDAPNTDKTNLPGQNVGTIRVISEKSYGQLSDLIQLPKELQDNPDLARLSQQKVQALNSGMSAFNQVLSTLNQSDTTFQSGYRFLSLFQTDHDQARINPFQTQLAHIRLLNKEDEFNQALQKAGYNSFEDFAITADTAAKAYRVNFIPLLLSFENRRFRAELPKTEIDRMAYTVAQMYEALPADVKLVAQNKGTLRNAFIRNGYQNILNGITIDELEKEVYNNPKKENTNALDTRPN